MLKASVRAILALVFCLSYAHVCAASDEKSYKELPNFHQVNDKLYRGAYPRKGGLEKLVELGVKTIIDLRAADEKARDEEAEAVRLGLRYFNIPMERFGRPTDEQVNHALSIINDAAGQPVFVHCNRGQDRTGVIIACYRIERDGWTGERAKAEAKEHGMKFWQRGMKDYIKDFYKRKAEATIEKSAMIYGLNMSPH